MAQKVIKVEEKTYNMIKKVKEEIDLPFSKLIEKAVDYYVASSEFSQLLTILKTSRRE